MGIKFNSNEFWQNNNWDRYGELGKVPIETRNEFLRQEELTVQAVKQFGCSGNELTVLDLACGTGRIAASIVKATKGNAFLTLVDSNLSTLDLAKYNLRNCSKVNFVCANALDIGNQYIEAFDVVVCLDFLHHVSNVPEFINSVSRSIKPGGIMIGNAFSKEKYIEWDRLKYGFMHSTKRWLINRIVQTIYSSMPGYAQKVIREKGWGRIEPLEKIELFRELEKSFSNIKVVNNYYHWFCAYK